MAEYLNCKICGESVYDALSNSNTETEWEHESGRKDHKANPYRNPNKVGE